jgi:putative transposase
MPRRTHILANDEIYHVYNRSVGHEEIIASKRTLNRILELLDYYKYPQRLRFSKYKTLPEIMKIEYTSLYLKKTPTVELYAYAFMPNHYHLLIKQLKNNGIAKFIANIQNSYAKYFNLKYDRHGSLFDHPFKAKRVETDEDFIHISRYIHLNPVTSYLIEVNQLKKYPWTSLPHYFMEKSRYVNCKKILALFSSREKYLKFVTDHADYQRKLGDIKHLIIDG